MVTSVFKTIWALLCGLRETLGYFLKTTVFGKPITQRYPEQKRTPYPRYHGLHKLLRDDKGKEKCVACCLCARVCPAQCITIDPAEDESHAKHYEINTGRCIFCGYCVEACPVGALQMSGEYELAEYTRKELVYNKERLLEK